MINLSQIVSRNLRVPSNDQLEGSAVPVVFGNVKVEGKSIFTDRIEYLSAPTTVQKEYMQTYGDMEKAYAARVWYTICMGCVKLFEILCNDKKITNELLVYGFPIFSDGAGNSYTPSILNPFNIICLVGGSFETTVTTPNLINFFSYQATGFFGGAITAICYNATKDIFVIGAESQLRVGDNEPVGNRIFTSKDGVTWKLNPTFKVIEGLEVRFIDIVCFDGTRYIAVCHSGGGVFTTTDPDGAWAKVNIGYGVITSKNSIAYNGEFYFILKTSTDVKLVKSFDGVTWTTLAYNFPTQLGGFSPSGIIVYGDGRWVVPYPDGHFYYSDNDGATWQSTYASSTKFHNVSSMVYNKEEKIYVCVRGSSSRKNAIFKITDITVYSEETWITDLYDAGVESEISLSEISYYNGGYAAVGGYTTIEGGGIILTCLTADASIWVKRTATPATTADMQAVLLPAGKYNSLYTSRLKGISHIYFDQTDALDNRVISESNGTLPKLEFAVGKFYEYYDEFAPDGYANDYNAVLYAFSQNHNADIYPNFMKNTSEFIGSNPAVVILEVLLNKQWGLGIDFEYIDLGSFEDIADEIALGTNGRLYGISFSIDSITAAKEIFEKIKDCTDIYLVVDEGKISCRNLYSTTASVISLDDEDFVEITIEKESWEDVPNVFTGEYIEPGTRAEPQYVKRSLMIRNEAVIEQVGAVNQKTIDLTMFSSKEVATVRLNEIMQRESRPRTRINVSVDHRLNVASVGDIVIISSTEYGIPATKYRVIQKSIGGLSDLQIAVDLQEEFSTLFTGQTVSLGTSQGGTPQSAPSNPTGSQSTVPVTAQNLTFAKYSDESSVMTTPFVNDNNAKVQWGANQQNTGLLAVGTDYTILGGTGGVGGNKIKLTNKWISTYLSNTLGLLNIDVWE